jgi:hypothetical protein
MFGKNEGKNVSNNKNHKLRERERIKENKLDKNRTKNLYFLLGRTIDILYFLSNLISLLGVFKGTFSG